MSLVNSLKNTVQFKLYPNEQTTKNYTVKEDGTTLVPTERSSVSLVRSLYTLARHQAHLRRRFGSLLKPSSGTGVQHT